MFTILVPQSSLPILCKKVVASACAERFPIHRIYCVGRNFREHALEMGGDPQREPPFFFQKPPDAIVDTSTASSHPNGAGLEPCIVPYPPLTSSLHHEGELVVAIGKGGLRIPVDEAERHIFGYAVGCDLTRRDLQAEAKKKGRPWDSAKGFDHSAPCGPIMRKDDVELRPQARISLEVNGMERQKSTLDRMVWDIKETISHLSSLYRLKPGDLIFSGTPAGVAELNIGDSVRITCGELPPCQFSIGPQETV